MLHLRAQTIIDHGSHKALLSERPPDERVEILISRSPAAPVHEDEHGRVLQPFRDEQIEPVLDGMGVRSVIVRYIRVDLERVRRRRLGHP
jgi:hypothetical protein